MRGRALEPVPVGIWEALANLSTDKVIIGVLLIMLFSSWTTVFYAVLSGRLVPKADRDMWRQAHQESEKTRGAVAELLDKQTDSTDKLIVQVAGFNELLRSLQRDGGHT